MGYSKYIYRFFAIASKAIEIKIRVSDYHRLLEIKGKRKFFARVYMQEHDDGGFTVYISKRGACINHYYSPEYMVDDLASEVFAIQQKRRMTGFDD